MRQSYISNTNYFYPDWDDTGSFNDTLKRITDTTNSRQIRDSIGFEIQNNLPKALKPILLRISENLYKLVKRDFMTIEDTFDYILPYHNLNDEIIDAHLVIDNQFETENRKRFSYKPIHHDHPDLYLPQKFSRYNQERDIILVYSFRDLLKYFEFGFQAIGIGSLKKTNLLYPFMIAANEFKIKILEPSNENEEIRAKKLFSVFNSCGIKLESFSI